MGNGEWGMGQTIVGGFSILPILDSRFPALCVANYAPSTHQTAEVPVAGHNKMLKRRRNKNYALKQLAKAKKAAKKARNKAKKGK